MSRITNENIVFQNWDDIKKKVLKNSEWKFIRIDFGYYHEKWRNITLICENQRGIRAYLRNNDPIFKGEIETLNEIDGKVSFNTLTPELINKLGEKVKSWNLQFGRNMFGKIAPNQDIEVKELSQLEFKLKSLAS